MESDDSTAGHILQDSLTSGSILVSTAAKVRRWSHQFGWPALILFGVAPLNAMDFRQSVLWFFFLGFPAVTLAILLRLWSRGYQREDGFVLDGPYRYVRNPVELGALIGYAGAGIILGVTWWFNFLTIGLATFFMSFAAISYERELLHRLGSTYLRYKKRVFRWIPSRYPAVNRSGITFSLARAISNEKETFLWILGYAIIYALRKHFG